MTLTNKDLTRMVKTGSHKPYEIQEEAIRGLARELLRVRLVVQSQAPAIILRGQRILPDWAISVIHGEGDEL